MSKPFTSALLAMAAASWSMAEAMPRWRISGLTNTAATHGEYCGRCTQSFWMTEQLPTGIPPTSATTVYGTLSFCVWVRRPRRLTPYRRSHSADSTTDGRSSSQLLPRAADTPRVVALGMSSPVALLCRTRIKTGKLSCISAAIRQFVEKDGATSTRFWGKTRSKRIP